MMLCFFRRNRQKPLLLLTLSLADGDRLEALEQEFERYLNYSRTHIRLDLTESRRFYVAHRQAEVGVVQDIE